MKLDATTLAYMYAHSRDEWRELEEEAERAELACDYDRRDEIVKRILIVRNNIRKVKADLAKYEIKEESE